MRAYTVEEVRPYRLVRDDVGRYAVLEVRCDHVYSLEPDHPRHAAWDTEEGIVQVVGHGWTDRVRATALFRQMVDGEDFYSRMLW